MRKKLFLICILGCLAGCGSPFLAPIGEVFNVVSDWKDGEAHKYYSYNLDSIHNSTKRTLANMGIKINEEQKRSDGYYILAGDGDRFKITIIRKNNETTLVKIRVNFWGDHDFADLIFSNIEKNLSTISF